MATTREIYLGRFLWYWWRKSHHRDRGLTFHIDRSGIQIEGKKWGAGFTWSNGGR